MKEDINVEYTARPAPAAFRRVSWGAIFAGLFVTIVIQIILTLLGAAVGTATINPIEEARPAEGLGIASLIWLVASGLISLFAGTYVAGRLSGGPRRADGMLHGIVTFSVAQVVMFLMLTTAAGALLGGAGAMLGEVVGGAQDRRTQGMLSEFQNEIQQRFPQAGALLPPTGRTQGSQTPGQLTSLAAQDPELGAAVAQMAAQGGPNQAPREKEQIISLLTTKHGMSQQQASALVDQWGQSFQQASAQTEQQAREAGQQAASGVSKAAFSAFVAMILGLAVAAWGGWAGTASLPRYRDVETVSAS